MARSRGGVASPARLACRSARRMPRARPLRMTSENKCRSRQSCKHWPGNPAPHHNMKHHCSRQHPRRTNSPRNTNPPRSRFSNSPIDNASSSAAKRPPTTTPALARNVSPARRLSWIASRAREMSSRFHEISVWEKTGHLTQRLLGSTHGSFN